MISFALVLRDDPYQLQAPMPSKPWLGHEMPMRDTALRVHLKRMWLPKEDSKEEVQKLIREKPLSTLDLSLYQPLLPSVLDFQPYPCELLDLDGFKQACFQVGWQLGLRCPLSALLVVSR